MIHAKGLKKTFYQAGNAIAAVSDVNLSIKEGEIVTIMGRSGSGKTTLLNLLGAILKPDAGEIQVAGTMLATMNERDLTSFRSRQIGFVFQSFNLIPDLTAAENIRLPVDLANERVDYAYEEDLISFLDLRERLKHKPAELSGGQQQRVTVARALIRRPAVLLADEPTGNLDVDSSRELLKLFRKCNEQFNQTIVIVTHDPEVAASGTTRYEMTDGCLNRLR